MIILTNVRIIAPGDALHNQSRDILIEDGRIAKIAASNTLQPSSQHTVWQQPGLCISPGWMDMFAQIGEPGFEYREDYVSAAKAAAAGGFTTVCVLPNTSPVVDDKAQVLYVLARQSEQPVRFLPLGAMTKGCKGEEMAEMYDMHEAGAVAFTDGKNSVQHAGVLMRSLQYIKAFDGLILHQAHDKTLAHGGQMHEGEMSTQLGMKGIPVIAEEVMMERDIQLLEYVDAQIHFVNVSSARAVNLIRKARQRGLRITASVNPVNLCFTDHDLEEFDSNLKVMPPIRSEDDRKALWEGLADGTIDCIVSHHVPLDTEQKDLEFPYAGFGAETWEAAFAACCTHAPAGFSIDQLIEKITVAPARILKRTVTSFSENEAANFTVFNPDTEWTFAASDIRSRSKNNPFVGHTLKGKVFGTILGTKAVKL